MKVSKQQISLGVVLAVGAVALTLDRCFFLKRAETEVAATSEFAVVPAAKSAPAATAPAVPALSVAQRLRNAAAVNDQPARDAFALPLAMQQPQQELVEAPSVDTEAQFKRAHRLTGILSSGGQSRAMVDGRMLSVGHALDGYRLVSIEHRTATFQRDDSSVVLTMAERAAVAASGQ